MPVIQLPTDRRWGDLGAGLGALIGQVVQARQDNQTATGVGQIMQDPNVSDDQKLPEVLRQYGDRGANIYTQIIRSQVLRGQLGLQQSEVAKNQAASGYYTAETTALPAKNQAAIDKENAQAAEAQAHIPQIQAQTEETQKNIPLKQDEDQLTTLKIEQKQRELDAQAANMAAQKAGAPPTTPIDPILDGLKLTPQQRQSAQQMYRGAEINKPGSGPDVALKWANEQSFKESGVQVDIRKQTEGAGAEAESAKAFMTSFDQDPNIGTLKGATVKKFLEDHGLPTGNANLINMADASLLQAADQAKSGGGISGVWRLTLGKDVTPGIRETPLRAVLMSKQLLDRQIEQLEQGKVASQTIADKESFQRSIDKWRNEVAPLVDAYQVYPVNNNDRTIVAHNGDLLNAKTFTKDMDANKVYLKAGHTVLTGADIVNDAVSRKMDPVVRMAEMKQWYLKHGYDVQDASGLTRGQAEADIPSTPIKGQ
jgi:hypothetical protein